MDRARTRAAAQTGASRRRFLAGAGGAGALALLAACGKDEVPTKQPPPLTEKQRGSAADSRFGKGDVGILNYALTLEYVETDFYDRALRSGALKDAKAKALVEGIRRREHEHVDAVRRLVRRAGGKPVERPKTDFTSVVEGGEHAILVTAATFENVGAAAYLGQGEFVEDKAILREALSIHTVEAQHAAALNEVAGIEFVKSEFEGSLPSGAFAHPLPMDKALRQIEPFLA